MIHVQQEAVKFTDDKVYVTGCVKAYNVEDAIPVYLNGELIGRGIPTFEEGQAIIADVLLESDTLLTQDVIDAINSGRARLDCDRAIVEHKFIDDIDYIVKYRPISYDLIIQ